MDLIDRYAHEVGQHLPHRLRADVEAELRSLLTDSVEEKARQAGIPADEALAAVSGVFAGARKQLRRLACRTLGPTSPTGGEMQPVGT